MTDLFFKIKEVTEIPAISGHEVLYGIICANTDPFMWTKS